MKSKLLTLIISLLCTPILFGATIIKNVKIEDLKNSATKMVIDFEGDGRINPELMVRDNIVQISLTNSTVWPKIEKKVTLVNDLDTLLMSYQFSSEITRTRVVFPYSVKDVEAGIHFAVRGKQIIVEIPKSLTAQDVKAIAKVAKKITDPKKGAEAYDEKYLDQLLAEKISDTVGEEKIETAPTSVTDSVKVTQSADTKMGTTSNSEQKKPSFSVLTYLGKFILFMVVMLGGFYLVMNFLRKGAMKSGKLGFLNKTTAVQVLSTNYVAPKTAILTVKVYNQIFLLGSSENGLQFLSEIKDTTGFIKETEKSVAGNNFDSTYADVATKNRDFRLKEFHPAPTQREDVEQNEVVTGDDVIANLVKEVSVQKERVKFSDQIKKKVKNLKALQ